MVRNMTIAEKLGYLKVPEGVLVDLKKVDEYRPDELVLMCTGSQGEPMAALSRMANGDHKIQLEPLRCPYAQQSRRVHQGVNDAVHAGFVTWN